MSRRAKNNLRSRIFVASTLAATAAQSFGEGFRNPPPGAYNLGRSGGRFAQNDDPSTAYHNPANTVNIEGTTLSIAPSAVYIHIERNGGAEETTDPWKLLPNFFATHKISDNLSAGLAVVTPYGLSNEWDIKGEFANSANPFSLRYQAPWYTEMKTINLNPSISYRMNESLSVGAGLNVHWSELTFKQFYPWWAVAGNPALPDGNIKARGDGIGLGGNFGVTWQFIEGHRLAATVRTPVEVDYDGYAKIDNIPAGFPVGQPRSHFSSRIETPTIVGIGYGIDVNEAVQIEFSFEWLEFSNFKNLVVDAGANNVLVTGSTAPLSQAQNWENTFTAGLGGSWKFAEEWRLNSGYQFYESPVPDANFTTTIPDANQHVFTVGLQWKRGRHSFEGAYGGIFYDERNINRTDTAIYNGRYDITVHLFALGYTFAF